MLRVCGKGTKVVLVPLRPAVGRAIDRAICFRERGSILLNTCGARMDRHAATRRLLHLAEAAGTWTATRTTSWPPTWRRHLTQTTPPAATALNLQDFCPVVPDFLGDGNEVGAG